MPTPVSLEIAEASPISISRIAKWIFNLHHLASAALLICALNCGVCLAITCYGLTILLIAWSLKLTHDRNLRFQSS